MTTVQFARSTSTKRTSAATVSQAARHDLQHFRSRAIDDKFSQLVSFGCRDQRHIWRRSILNQAGSIGGTDFFWLRLERRMGATRRHEIEVNLIPMHAEQVLRPVAVALSR